MVPTAPVTCSAAVVGAAPYLAGVAVAGLGATHALFLHSGDGGDGLWSFGEWCAHNCQVVTILVCDVTDIVSLRLFSLCWNLAQHLHVLFVSGLA